MSFGNRYFLKRYLQLTGCCFLEALRVLGDLRKYVYNFVFSCFRRHWDIYTWNIFLHKSPTGCVGRTWWKARVKPTINHRIAHRLKEPCSTWHRAHTSTCRLRFLNADSHIPCRAHAVPLPCLAAKGLEHVFPIWFTECGRVWFTFALPWPCRAHAMLWPCRSSQGHGTARPSREDLWATCPL
jgi:hypothetical protein